MENSPSIFSIVLIGFAIFLLVRLAFYHIISRHSQKKTVESWYSQVLNNTEFKVKGKYE